MGNCAVCSTNNHVIPRLNSNLSWSFSLTPSMEDSMGDPTSNSMRNSMKNSTRNSTRSLMRNSMRNSTRNSMVNPGAKHIEMERKSPSLDIKNPTKKHPAHRYNIPSPLILSSTRTLSPTIVRRATVIHISSPSQESPISIQKHIQPEGCRFSEPQYTAETGTLSGLKVFY